MLDQGSDASGLVGTVLAGRYRILSLLGEGAMGAVYLGEHLKIGRRDAIKVLRPGMARDEEAIARFTRGARHASGIRHPNVCAIYDFGTTEQGLHFLAMEFVDGGSLSEVMDADGRLGLERATDILLQAAGALQVAHDRGIIHRDLKPDNIMLSREPGGSELVKVVDFDIALGPQEGEGARVTRHGYVVGTPEYMSPEQLTGDPLDARSDVYSLALVFFRMLTGRLPFDSGTAQEVMVRRLTVDPLPLREAAPDAGLPDALEPVLSRALARKAADRYASAAEFAGEVARVAGGGPSQAAPSGPAGATRAGGSGGGAAADGAIPRTRVSSTADEREGAGGGGPGVRGGEGRDAAGRKLPPPLALAAGGVTLIGAIVAGVLFVTSSGESDPGGLALPAVEEPAAEAAAAGGETEAGEAAGEAGTETGAGSAAGGGAPAPDGAEEAPPAAEATPVPQPGTDEAAAGAPSPEPSAPPAPAIQLPAEDAEEILIRQLLARDEAGGDERPALEATRDTTLALWSTAAMNRADSALASYILGAVLIPLGDSVQGVRWLEEAVRLDPQRGYVELLEFHQGGLR